MQEPSSPLAPLDPTRLQQQIQQPMGESSVNRSMSSSSIGSIDSAASLNQFSCSSSGALADNVQQPQQMEFGNSQQNQIDVRQWSSHHDAQQKMTQHQGSLVGHGFKPASQENTMASLSSPASTHYSTVPNSPMTGHNPGTPSANQASQFSHAPQHGHNNQNVAVGGGGQLVHQQYGQQQLQQSLPHNYQQQMIFAQQHLQRNPTPSQQQVAVQMNSPVPLNAGSIHSQQQHLVRQQSSFHAVQQNVNQQFFAGQEHQQQQQRFIVQVAGSQSGQLMRPQMSASSVGQPVTIQNSIVNFQGAMSGQQNQQHLAPSPQQFTHQLSPRQSNSTGLQQKTSFAVGGQQQQMIISSQHQQQPPPLQPHQNFVQNQQKLAINNQQRMQQMSFVERPNLQTQQNFQGATSMAQIRMTHNVVSLPPHSQQQNLSSSNNNGQSIVITPGAAPSTPTSPQNQTPQQQQQHHGRPNVPQMYIIGGSGPINVHQVQNQQRIMTPMSPRFNANANFQQVQHLRGAHQSVPQSPTFAPPACSVNNGIQQQMTNVSQVNNTPSHANINTYQQQQQPQVLHRSIVVAEQPSQQQQQQFQYFGHDPNFNVPPETCLVGCVFLILDYERLLDQKEISDWRVCILQHGGEVENSYTARCTHIVCDSLRNSTAQQAIKENKRCVSAQWLNDCVQLKRMQPPWKIVHFPSHYGDNKPCKNKIFAASGFDVSERLCIRQMAAAVGARYTSYLSKHNTLLIAKCLDGEKVAKAVEWKIPIVNVQWLYELFLGQHGALQSLNNPRYHQFLTKEALQMVNIDLFRIDPNAAPIPVLMGAWRSPIQVTPECWKNATERKQKLEDDAKLFPYKKLRLSPAPEEEDIRSKRNVQSLPFDNVQTRIAFTGFYSLEVENLAKKALWLGAIVESNVKECTHLVTPDLKRTKKVLEALALGRLIVSPAWIKQSYKQQRLLDCLEFIVKDEGNEKFFGFNVKLSIFKARQKPLFEEIVFYLTPSVQPSPTILTDLIQTSGGTILQQKPSINKIMDFQQNAVQLAIITCDNDIHLCQTWIEFGFPIHSAEFVLTGILRQEIDFQSYRIEPKSVQSSVSSILESNLNNNNPMINANSKILSANVNNIQIVQHIM